MKRYIITILAAASFSSQTHGAEYIQTFDSRWAIAPWNYEGTVSARQWQYLPYVPWDSSFGTLQEVDVNTNISGSRDISSDPISIRYAFSTGWAPNAYQFYNQLAIDPGSAQFTSSQSYIFFSDESLANWKNTPYLPRANYYFESNSPTSGHTISATTSLRYVYSVPEPETYTMMFTGIALLMFVSKRKIF